MSSAGTKRKKISCVVYPVSTPQGFAWQWRSDNGHQSKSTFPLFFDCVTDARTRGFVVDHIATLAAAKAYQAKVDRAACRTIRITHASIEAACSDVVELEVRGFDIQKRHSTRPPRNIAAP